MTGRVPNRGLDRLYRETGWTLSQFAHEVNRVGTERGTPLKYRAQSAHQWLDGHLPREETRSLVLEALARRLGRPVTRTEVGFPPPIGGGADDDHGMVENLVTTGKEDMDPSRREVLAATLYAAALPVPAYADLVDRSRASATGRTTRIGTGEVATVRTMTDRIADILDELGGGHARPMAAAFLVNTVGPYLRTQASEEVRKDLMSAVSDLVYLTGWMAMYERAHGLGQRYYLQALQFAAAGEDHITYCRTLRGMALQAANLKHANKALSLADAAAEAAPKAGPRLHAFLAGQQAHGAALTGNKQLAFTRLAETETALSKADGRRDAIGGYDQAAYLFHVSSVRYALGDVHGSITSMQESNRVRPPVEKQGRAHANGLLAQRQLEIGHLEAACDTWHTFLDDYERLSSSRADEHFDTLRSTIRPYLKNPHARQVHDRARQLARQKAS